MSEQRNRPEGVELPAGPLAAGLPSSMRKAACQVEVRAVRPSTAAVEFLRRFGTWFVSDGEDFVFRSPLRNTTDPNEHLQWFHGMLAHDRKLIRRLQEQGLSLVVRISCDRLPLVIASESLLLAHKLNLPTEVVAEGMRHR